jgi:hypothetical protein
VARGIDTLLEVCTGRRAEDSTPYDVVRENLVVAESETEIVGDWSLWMKTIVYYCPLAVHEHCRSHEVDIAKIPEGV